MIEEHPIHHDLLGFESVAVRPGNLSRKNAPPCKEEESAIRAERVKIYSERLENNQDIWSGNPLPFDVSKIK